MLKRTIGMSKCSAILFFFWLLASTTIVRAANEDLRAIVWPGSLVLPSRDLRIDEIHIVLACGEFRAIRNIPDDWNVEVLRPVSQRSELHLSAGHGGSDLPSLDVLKGAIVVSGVNSDCFALSATVTTQTSEKKFTKGDLGLAKVAP